MSERTPTARADADAPGRPGGAPEAAAGHLAPPAAAGTTAAPAGGGPGLPPAPGRGGTGGVADVRGGAVIALLSPGDALP